MKTIINKIGEYVGKCKREFKDGFKLGYDKTGGAIQSVVLPKAKNEVE